MTDTPNPDDDLDVEAADVERTMEDAEGGVESSTLDAPDEAASPT